MVAGNTKILVCNAPVVVSCFCNPTQIQTPSRKKRLRLVSGRHSFLDLPFSYAVAQKLVQGTPTQKLAGGTSRKLRSFWWKFCSEIMAIPTWNFVSFTLSYFGFRRRRFVSFACRHLAWQIFPVNNVSEVKAKSMMILLLQAYEDDHLCRMTI